MSLPVEWKAELALLPDMEVKRLENMLDRGITHPLSEEKASGPFMLFLLGNSLEDIASKTGTPKDVIMLTFLKYRWNEKRSMIMSQGMGKVVEDLYKEMVNMQLFVTYRVMMDQMAQVLSGKLPQEKCTYIARNQHAVSELIETVKKANNIKDDQDKKPGNNIIQAQNVQINQSIEAPKEEVKRIPRGERLANRAKDKE